MAEVLDQAAVPNTGEKAPKEGPRRDPLDEYGQKFEKLPENLQTKLRQLLKKAQERDVFARRRELMRVQKNRFFELGFQHTWWDEDQGIFQVGQAGGGIQNDGEDDGPLYQRDIMLYQAFEKSFRSVFCQNQAPVRFQAEDPKEGRDITAAQEANKHKRVIEKYNPPRNLQDDVGRLLWTDGSVIAYTRMVWDGQRFGFEEEEEDLGAEDAAAAAAGEPGAGNSIGRSISGSAAGIPGSLNGADQFLSGNGDNGLESADGGLGLSAAGEDTSGVDDSGVIEPEGKRQPKGREVIDMFGVLERKCPLSIRDPHSWPYLILSTEHDISIEKAVYPEIEEKIKPGSAAPGAEQRARLARIACSQGASWEGNSESTLEYLVTKDLAWFRPAFFTELGPATDPDRKQLEELFPDGCHCVFIGETYCESRNESLDKHIKVMQAMRANGQNVPGMGQSAIDPCEAFDDMFNMSEEAFKNTIPMKIFRNGVLDLEALNERTNGYGQYLEANQSGAPELPFGDNFFEETPVTPPAQMQQAMGDIQGPLLQFLTGQLAPLMGQSDEHNETAKGISILRDQALGLMNLVWTPFTIFYGEVMTDAVRCGADNRDPDKPLSTLVGVPGKEGKEETVDVSIEDLKSGNFTAVPVVDANFPESWTQKSNRFFGLFQSSAENPLLMKLMAHPDNQELAKNMVGLEDMEFPDADAVEKQVGEIARLSKESPIPPSQEELQAAIGQEMEQLQTAAQTAAAAGAPVPQIDPEALQQKLGQQLMQKLTKSSVEVDPICDNHQVEAEECLRWINSPTGQKAKNSPDQADRDGYMNVRLHLLEHQAVMKQQAQQAAMQAAAIAMSSGSGQAGAAPAPAAGAA